MPCLPPNIDKSGFHRGEYVGYSEGAVYRIRRADRHTGWAAIWSTGAEVSKARLILYGRTLAILSAALAA